MRLNNRLRTQINKVISTLITSKNKTKYFEKIPLTELFTILKDNHIVPLQEDFTEWNGLLCGHEATVTFLLADIDTMFLESYQEQTYTPFTNAMLSLSWYQMGSGRYEIVCYVS